MLVHQLFPCLALLCCQTAPSESFLTICYGPPPPALCGVILSINSCGFVELSLGSDDGIHPTHQFDVYRADKLVGRVEVLNTSTDTVVARSLKSGPIQRGDRVVLLLHRPPPAAVDDESTQKVPPSARGKVIRVNQNRMVELSLGSNDGLRATHQLDAYRGQDYLGRVEVLSTSTDRAVAMILMSYQRGTIQPGDDVVAPPSKSQHQKNPTDDNPIRAR